MLTEHFIASVGPVPAGGLKAVAGQNKGSAPAALKDAGIFIHEYLPTIALKTAFKKSASGPNSIVANDTHVFAAQAEKAVVHVYAREKGVHEATVPFPERISSLTLACGGLVLVLGTVEGRVFAWEIASGRQITTAQAHLQAVTALAVDPLENFLLSSSRDSTVHVWALPRLLSFASVTTESLSPVHTFTAHKADVVALAVGHSASFANVAVSASIDKTCFVWDYHLNNVLRTYLLPEVPTSIALDPADRAVYIGYVDGSVQQIDLFAVVEGKGSRLESVQSSRAGSAPIQPPASTKWTVADAAHGATLCLSVSFDGCNIVSGHESGHVLAWDATKGRYQSSILANPLPGPVTNLKMLPVLELPQTEPTLLNIQNVIKPKFGAFDGADGFVPTNYTLQVELADQLRCGEASDFEQALHAPSFPQELLDEGLAELCSWNQSSYTKGPAGSTDDFVSFDESASTANTAEASLQKQNAALKEEVEALRRVQKASFAKMEQLNAEKDALLQQQRQTNGH